MSQNIEEEFVAISRDEAENIKKECQILIITATKVETDALHNQLNPFKGQRSKVGIDNHTYFIGTFGGHLIFHVQCNAGSVSSNGSAIVANHGLSYCKPKMILMVGIAFGMDKKSQKIGDILICETIAPYEIQRIGLEKNIQRGGFPKASIYLGNRFKYHKWNGTYKLTEKGKDLKSIISQGLMLSGEKLIDNSDEKEKLRKAFPESIGGEMEGIGIASTCEPHKLDWIIVKGICDFADGNKKRNKKLYQQIASKNAVDFCKSALSEPHLLDELGISQGEIESEVHDVNKVLFKSYQKDAEPYYLERIDDDEFYSFISNYSIWIHGSSGTGKSTLIVRNLLLAGFQIIQINLASASDYSLASILKDIRINLCIYFNLPVTTFTGSNEDEIVSEISNLIVKHFNFSKHIIHIDEIPEYETDSIFTKFVHALYVINSNVQIKIHDVKSVFVLSSITSAKKLLHGSQGKMTESFKFMEFGLWDGNDILKLVNIINEKLNLNFTEDEIASIVKTSKGTPRNVKKIIRDYISTLNNKNYNLARILEEIDEENK